MSRFALLGLAEFPRHLLLPLASSLLFATGLLFIKKATQRGSNSWTITLTANLWAAALFSVLWLLGGARQPWQLYWQPAVIAGLFISGQICTFLAINRGDVSVAAPIFSTKVLMVAVFLTVVAGQSLSAWVWLAALAATVGVALIQQTGRGERHHRVPFTIAMAMLAATNYALFDVLVQRWAPAWGPGRFLPTVFWMAGFLSLGLLPWVDRAALCRREVLWPTLLGSLLFASQSFCIVLAIASFGDAARINIVYSLRGIWGVIAAWMFADWLGGGESHAAPRVMFARLAGAALLSAAVVVAILRG